MAALLVLLFHAELLFEDYFGAAPFGRPFSFGHAGVDFFFVLSGFILMWVHGRDIGRPERLAPFASRRVRRVMLPYWVVLALILPVYFVMPGFGQGFERDPSAILAAITLFPDPRGYTLAVAWTLTYELLFYALFGLLIAAPRLGWPLLAIWVVGGVLVRGGADWPLNVLLPHYALEFAAGMGVAHVLARGWRAPRPWLWLAGGALLFVAAGLSEVALGRVITSWVQALASVSLAAGAATLDLRGRVGWPRALMGLGDASYALYLTHYPALTAVAKAMAAVGLAAAAPTWVLWLLMLAIVVAGGVAFHWLVERRLLGLGAPVARPAQR